jgi:hypothetical protein
MGGDEMTKEFKAQYPGSSAEEWAIYDHYVALFGEENVKWAPGREQQKAKDLGFDLEVRGIDPGGEWVRIEVTSTRQLSWTSAEEIPFSLLFKTRKRHLEIPPEHYPHIGVFVNKEKTHGAFFACPMRETEKLSKGWYLDEKVNPGLADEGPVEQWRVPPALMTVQELLA